MYSIFDKEAAVNQVLKYLGLVENGVYDERARVAVSEFQESVGLSPSGVVDYSTFTLLLNAYNKRLVKEEAKVGGLNNFSYSFGDSGSDVAIINAYLSDVLAHYSSDLISPRSAYFTRDTEAAVNFLRGVLGLSPSKNVDEEFFVRLMRDREGFYN